MDGIIDVGGGLRGIYTAGVYDFLFDNKIDFKYCLGVSAGSANLVSYIAKQRGRSFRFYDQYSHRKEYMSFNNILKGKPYLSLDYIYSTISNSDGEDPLDYAAFSRSESQLIVVATKKDGQPKYFTKSDMSQDNYDILKASSALPVFTKPCLIDGVPYFDGGMGDPLPFKKAFSDGCDRLVVLLTRPLDRPREPQAQLWLAKLALRKFPKVYEALATRHLRYNAAIAEVKKLIEQGKILVIAPKDIGNLQTLTRDKVILKQLYYKGYEDAAKIPDFLKADTPLTSLGLS
ncbi:MAG: patatin-like phospholipase family protein [Bdellovibrionota bacterium]